MHSFPLLLSFRLNHPESVVQASIVIITTAAGKMQDDTANSSLDNAVTLWLVYAFVCTAVSGILLLISNTALLPAARLSQVQPSELASEVKRLLRAKGLEDRSTGDIKQDEKLLKSATSGHETLRWLFLFASVGVVIIGWIMFGLGVSWGVHGSVIAGTTGE